MFELHWIDRTIVLAYIGATVAIGFWISKRASKNLSSYFLGGNTIPWYMLGLSNASGMFDISGTMLLVYWLFVYGLKSVWIPWLWPMFNQVFLMVFLSIWMRRSGVMTGAEWIRFRFGDGNGAKLAHLVVILFALVSVVNFLAYAFLGIGKFASTFLPWELSADPDTNIRLYGFAVISVTTLYVVKGGMFSVVFTEVLQFAIMSIACVWVALIAIQQVSPEMLAATVPDGWHDLFFGLNLGLDWSELMPAASDKIAQDGWEMFGFFVGLMVVKGVMQCIAGPAPNYDMQRILSARSPREAAYMSGIVSVVLMVPRYLLVTGLTVLALVFFSDQLNAMGDDVDFELILPFAMREFMPTGLLGLLIAALLAAFMSTYAATVNAAPAYVVNDIVKRYLLPDASDRTYVRLSYLTSVVVVLLGTLVGLNSESVDDVVQWIVAALLGSYTAANLLKWIWWRFNSYGYFWGMASGIAAAAITPRIAEWMHAAGYLERVPADIYLFPAIFVVSLAGSVIGALSTPPDDTEVLKEFYRRVRPWGYWGPIQEMVLAENPAAEPNRDFSRDMINCAIGTCWQTALMTFSIYTVLRNTAGVAWSVGVIVVTTLILKRTWFDRITDYPPDYDPSGSKPDSPG